jgi:hypothetical protein
MSSPLHLLRHTWHLNVALAAGLLVMVVLVDAVGTVSASLWRAGDSIVGSC